MPETERPLGTQELRSKNFTELLAGFKGFKSNFNPGKLDVLWDMMDKDKNGTLDLEECGDFLDIVKEALANDQAPTE